VGHASAPLNGRTGRDDESTSGELRSGVDEQHDISAEETPPTGDAAGVAVLTLASLGLASAMAVVAWLIMTL
jgi:hypothetical protein